MEKKDTDSGCERGCRQWTQTKQVCSHEYHDDWGERYSEHLPCVMYRYTDRKVSYVDQSDHLKSVRPVLNHMEQFKASFN